MIEFGGTIYYLDIDALDKAITPKIGKPSDKVSLTEYKEVTDKAGKVVGTETVTTTSLRGKEIDGPKYDILRMMIETLIDYDDDESDTTLGADRALDKTPLSYKLAFNTLYNYGILKEKE
jgi:hypothetical protein